jgi:hypothetical protein
LPDRDYSKCEIIHLIACVKSPRPAYPYHRVLRVRLTTRGGYDWRDRYPLIVEAALKNKVREMFGISRHDHLAAIGWLLNNATALRPKDRNFLHSMRGRLQRNRRYTLSGRERRLLYGLKRRERQRRWWRWCP